MILLDIHRGTSTQESIGTLESDVMKLYKQNLIHDNGKDIVITPKGEFIIDAIKHVTI